MPPLAPGTGCPRPVGERPGWRQLVRVDAVPQLSAEQESEDRLRRFRAGVPAALDARPGGMGGDDQPALEPGLAGGVGAQDPWDRLRRLNRKDVDAGRADVAALHRVE